MRCKSKSFPLLIILILAVSSIIAVKPTYAQSTTTPSVPEFTVQIVNNPYFVPQTNSTDPYTGKVTIYPSHTAENKSVVVTVKNQQFVSSQIADGNWTKLYYNLRFEGHFIQNDWTYYPLAPEDGYINASQSDYTVIPLPTWLLPATYSNGIQIDFQVQALIGYDESMYAGPGSTGELYWIGNLFTGQSSDWSPSQTLVFGETTNSSPTPSPSVTATPSPTAAPSSTPTNTPSATPTPRTGIFYGGVNQIFFNAALAIIGLLIVIIIILVYNGRQYRKKLAGKGVY